METSLTIREAEAIAENNIKAGKTAAEVKTILVSKGISDTEAEMISLQVRATYLTAQRKKGMPLLAIGAMCCIGGFLITALSAHTGTLFHIGLFGFTGVGATLLIIGLVFVLG